MKWIHANNYVHRDLAARNILLNESRDGSIVVKIGDFGLCQYADHHYINYEDSVPFRWSAPEVISRKNYAKASDVWSFAIVMWEIYTCGDEPYRRLSNHQVEYMLRCNERLKFPAFSCNGVNELMAECWERRPSNRPTFKQIVAHLNDIFD